MPKIVIVWGAADPARSAVAKTQKGEPVVCSTNDWFTKRDGSFLFDASQSLKARADCFRRCVEAIHKRANVVIDDAALTINELCSYLALSEAYDYTCTILNVRCNRASGGCSRLDLIDLPMRYATASWITVEEVVAPVCSGHD